MADLVWYSWFCCGHITPEAFEWWLLALVRDKDFIEINVATKTLT